eukprot:m.8075 g.8075  ORF g.8075 m.8075 type:complete len:61 (+) comp2997_c1_seq1:37-219(+)
MVQSVFVYFVFVIVVTVVVFAIILPSSLSLTMINHILLVSSENAFFLLLIDLKQHFFCCW